MIVARVRTPVPVAGLEDVLESSQRSLCGFDLQPDSYRIARAQLELEHGTQLGPGPVVLRGVFNHNLGNHDATEAERDDPSVPIFETLPEHEESSRRGSFTAVHVRRSFVDAYDGAQAYLRTLLDGFPEAYEALRQADVDGFAAGLKKGGYFTADERIYAHTLRALLAMR